MSTEEEKAANRAKQARFQARHPGYQRKHAARRRIKPKMAAVGDGEFRIFELADPRDPDKLPRLIGYCRRSVTPVWSNYWLAKDHSKAPWAAWLRELCSLGLQPVELPTGMFGIATGLSEHLATRLVRLRVRRMNNVVMGNPSIAPPWSLRNVAACRGNYGRLPVGCLSSDGVIHYANARQAYKSIGLRDILILVERVDFDKHGRLWFED
jgi:hypothetical protein